MNFSKTTLILATLVSLSVSTIAHAEVIHELSDKEHVLSVGFRTGIHESQSLPINSCSDCSAVPYGSGFALGMDILHRRGTLEVGVSIEEQASPLWGPEESLIAAFIGRRDTFGILAIRSGLELGSHRVQHYSEFLSRRTVTNSDWAVLPFAGARLEGDLEVWPAAGLHLGVWTSLRTDVARFEQTVKMSSGLFEPRVQDHRYQAGSTQIAGGVKVGFSI